MKKALAIIAVVAALLAWGSQLDDPLNSDALSLLEKLDRSQDSEAFFYLLGIDAPSNADPIEAGRTLYEEYRKAEEDAGYEIIDGLASERLTRPEGDFFCKSLEQGCLESLFTTDIDLDSLLSEQALLLERVTSLHGYSDYRTLTKPSSQEQLPRYEYISAAVRLQIASAISASRKGHPEVALRELLGNIGVLRRQMEIQDQFVGKMVYLMLIAEHLDVASLVLSRHPGVMVSEAIPPLSLAEKRFDAVMAREIAMAYHTLKELDRHPEFWEIGGNAPGWWVRALYKPNMTINAMTPVYTRAIALSRLEPHEFARQITEKQQIPATTSRIRNVAGDILNKMSPDYDGYVGRLSDLNTKIHLFNQHHHHNKKPDEITNPYFEGESAFVSQGRICLTGPLEDKRNLRCLKISP